MPRVLMIGLTNSEGGSQRHILELSKRIEKCGLITDDKLSRKGFAGNLLFALQIYFVAIWALMFGKKKYDVIHIHENLLYFLTFNPILQFRYKIVITVHGLRGFKFYDYFWWPFSLALSCADKVISVNKIDQQLLLGNPRWHNLSIRITSDYIPNGVDMFLYDGNLEVFDDVVYIGRIHEQKGVDILLKALPKDMKLTIIGDDTREYAKELKRDWSLENVHWIGSIKDRKDIADILQTAKMIVLPSRWEGLPLTLFESLASGRPVIVSDIPAFKSVVSDKEVLFFSSENIEDLNRKIIKLQNDNNLAESLGKSGKEFAKDYDWGNIAKKTEELYGRE